MRQPARQRRTPAELAGIAGAITAIVAMIVIIATIESTNMPDSDKGQSYVLVFFLGMPVATVAALLTGGVASLLRRRTNGSNEPGGPRAGRASAR